MTDERDEDKPTKWRCPRCHLWVVEPLNGKCCQLCKECMAEDAEVAK
jgi:hypothetical protein